jgi:hypothetical protein
MIDAWWREGRDNNTFESIQTVVEEVASEKGYEIAHRQFGVTDSFEFKQPGSNKKVFSFQISVRDMPLDEPLISEWPPLRIETFRDNIGSKMNALVNRGAPRDLMDIYRVVNDGLLTTDECWMYWQEKNPGGDREEARGKALTHLTRLEQRRPLETITVAEERESAARIRQWYKEVFLSAPPEEPS